MVLRFQLIGTGRIVVLAFKRSSMEDAGTVAESLVTTCAPSRRGRGVHLGLAPKFVVSSITLWK